ncbi:NUDIX domain-containing protein [Kitasatospora purpeofusca]|uniref:NUDIX domain-containing protein n=1 Tax=Kitasatospora purpeofusca TaxID=67352 RepID=UPI00225A9ACA|nr:NUDIX domain-containing protein [Kitasatospora purpeofusca]MCX4684829.1 NUDIX domain-containing protein [Kitasatospora purpeofusca]
MTDTTDASHATDAAGTAAATAATAATAAGDVAAATDTAGAAGAPLIPRPPRPGDASRADELAALYPVLHAPQYWTWGRYDAQFSTVLPPDELVTNIHLVGFTDGDRVVLCRDDRNHWFLPGGTREHNESVDSCLVRELREEAGARLLGDPVWLGAHRCVTDDPVPYRPWQPHPEKAWLWGWADVAVDSVPTNPDDGEQVVEVRAVEPDEARRLLLNGHEAWWGELIALAVELRSRPR